MSTAVLIVKDFAIHQYPDRPSSISNILWTEFTDKLKQTINTTWNTNNKPTNQLKSEFKRNRIQYCLYAVGSCLCGYGSYASLQLTRVNIAFLVGALLGALIALIACGLCIWFAYKIANKLRDMIGSYRASCEQDMKIVFDYMNQKNNGLIIFGPARSTHTMYNGTIKLGISFSLQPQQLQTNQMPQQMQTSHIPLQQQPPQYGNLHQQPVQSNQQQPAFTYYQQNSNNTNVYGAEGV